MQNPSIFTHANLHNSNKSSTFAHIFELNKKIEDFMKKVFMAMMLCAVTLAAYAVPARRGWQTRTQADGSTIEVQVIGDEFYHYTINRDGKQVREINGMYQVVGEAPTPAVAKARRAKGVARRQRKDVGTEPNLAPKGVVILVNFSNKSMQSGHTQATFDELCNSLNCTVNAGYPSAGQYFADQSNGSYRPQFDVFGPVTLSRNVAYYGTDKPGDEEGDDQHATDAVVEGCILANQQFDINWADYDSDNDGYVDFVYVIYAGKGQADGGTSETIWPHNWSVVSARKSGYCTYEAAQCIVGGKKLDNYAMSGEMSGNSLGGIGTLCHEFGHVMGLPDLYDTDYGTNYENCLTPNDWDVMDGGSYNGDGHCPPNYDPWEKDFFGWLTPINLGSEGQNVTLYANGTENQQTYQINTSGKYVSPTTSGLRYYIENRQAVGWDEPLTGHGLLIWKVNFNATAWTDNAPNNTNTSGSPLYTVVSASGSKIGWDGSTDNCPKNTFPGSGNKTSWTGVSGKPLLNIAEANQVVTLTYIEEPTPVVDPFDVNFMAFGQLFESVQSTGTLVLPATNPVACSDGRVFVGWCTQASYSSPTTAPKFAKAGDAVAEGATFYAVFADQEGEGSAETTWDLVSNASSLNAGDVLVMACSSKGFTAGDISSQIMASVGSTFSSNNDQITSLGSETVELTLGGSAGAWTLSSTSGLLGATAVKKLAWGSGTTTWDISISGGDATIQNTTESYGRFLYNVNSPRFTTYTSNATASMLLPQLYRKTGGGASYSNYSTACDHGTGVESVQNSEVSVQKIIRNGQVLIFRDGRTYNILGVPVE